MYRIMRYTGIMANDREYYYAKFIGNDKHQSHGFTTDKELAYVYDKRHDAYAVRDKIADLFHCEIKIEVC